MRGSESLGVGKAQQVGAQVLVTAERQAVHIKPRARVGHRNIARQPKGRLADQCQAGALVLPSRQAPAGGLDPKGLPVQDLPGLSLLSRTWVACR